MIISQVSWVWRSTLSTVRAMLAWARYAGVTTETLSIVPPHEQSPDQGPARKQTSGLVTSSWGPTAGPSPAGDNRQISSANQVVTGGSHRRGEPEQLRPHRLGARGAKPPAVPGQHPGEAIVGEHVHR